VIELNETNVIWEWDLSLLDNQRVNAELQPGIYRGFAQMRRELGVAEKA